MTAIPTEPHTSLRCVLASTDFSETADHGVTVATHLASQAGAKLHLVHAIDATYIAASTLGMAPELHHGLHEGALERLGQVAADAASPGLEIVTAVRDGRPADVLIEEADEANADLLVLATHGHGGIAQTLLGSTAGDVLQRTARPVLSVHRGDEALERPPARVLVPTDLSESDAILAVEGARRLLGATPGTTMLCLVHAVVMPGGYHRNVAAASWQQMTKKLVDFAENELAQVADRLRVDGFDLELAARVDSDASTAILEVADQFRPDAIAMRTAERSTAGRLFLGSTARKVVQKAKRPVLTIRWSPPES